MKGDTMNATAKGKARAKMLAAGLTIEEVNYYLSEYPAEMWGEIIEWAKSPPALDACDDCEADEFYA